MKKLKSTPALEDLPERVGEKILAELWDLSPRTLQRARCTGQLKLPYLKVGRHVLYCREDIVKYEAQRKYLSTSQRVPGDQP